MTVPCLANAVAGRHGLPVVEENAHDLFGTYRGRMLGTLGVLATQSFRETKSITCGEGGVHRQRRNSPPGPRLTGS